MKEVNVDGAYCREYPIINEDIGDTADALVLMVDAIKREVKRKSINLVCTGTSGLYIATLMKVFEPKMFTIVYLRKDGISAHSGEVIQKSNKAATFLLVDDFIASGDTYNWCHERLIMNTRKRLTHVMMLGGGNSANDHMKADGIKTYFKGF